MIYTLVVETKVHGVTRRGQRAKPCWRSPGTLLLSTTDTSSQKLRVSNCDTTVQRWKKKKRKKQKKKPRLFRAKGKFSSHLMSSIP